MRETQYLPLELRTRTSVMKMVLSQAQTFSTRVELPYPDVEEEATR